MGHRSNINPQSRGYYYANSGDNDFDGRSFELPKKDIQVAIDSAGALIPTPSTSSPAFVKEAQGGVFITSGLTLVDSVLFEGLQSTIVTTGMVGVAAANFLSFRPQTLVSNTDNATALLIDGLTSFGTVMSALIVGGENGIGVEILGPIAANDNDDIFVTISQIRLSGENSKAIKFTGETMTPLDFNFNTISFDANGCTFFEFDPVNSTDVADLNVSSVFDGSSASPTAFASTTGMKVTKGTLKVRAGSIQASVVADVQTGGILSVSANAIAGNSIAQTGGAIVYDTVGVIFGDIETDATGSFQVQSTNIFGNAINAGNMSIKCDGFIGEIVNTGSMFVIIGNYTGILPENDGSINGVINGVYFGNWQQKPFEIEELFAFSTSDQIPLGLDTPLQIEFGAAQGSASDPVELKSNGAILIHKTNQYKFIILIQYGRTGSGGASWLFFRLLVDDDQVTRSIFVKLDGTGDDLPLQVALTLNLTAGQTVTVEFFRDSQGNDSGGLFVTTPTLGGWDAAASATVTVSSEKLIQALNLIAVLPGASGDYFSTPDSPAASITGDLDIQMRISATDWTPSTTETLISKWDDPSDNKSYLVQLTNTGALRVFLSEDGVITLGPATSSAVTGFIGGTLHWVRVTWDQVTGDVDFSTSEDNTDDPAQVSWVALGVTQNLSPAAIFDSTADVEVGAHNNGTINFDGTVSRASIFNGTTLAVDFNPQDYRNGPAFVSLLTGETWTLNGNVSIEL